MKLISSRFRIGLAKNIVKYVVTADAKLIDGQVERIKTIWYSSSSEVVAGADLTGTFTNEEKGINNATTTLIFSKTKRLLINLSVKKGDVVTVNTKDLFEDAHQLMEF
jgi:trigger factor